MDAHPALTKEEHGWWEQRSSHGVAECAGADCTDGEKCSGVNHEGFENQLGFVSF